MDMNSILALVAIAGATIFGIIIVYSTFSASRKVSDLWDSLIDFAFHDYWNWEDRASWVESQPSVLKMLSLKNTFKNPEEMIAGKYAQEFFVWRENPVEFKRVSEPPRLRIIN